MTQEDVINNPTGEADTSNLEGKPQDDEGLVCNINGVIHESFTDSSWLGDSCSTVTITNDDTGMFDCKQINELVGGFAGQSAQAVKQGKKNCCSSKWMVLPLHECSIW